MYKHAYACTHVYMCMHISMGTKPSIHAWLCSHRYVHVFVLALMRMCGCIQMHTQRYANNHIKRLLSIHVCTLLEVMPYAYMTACRPHTSWYFHAQRSPWSLCIQACVCTCPCVPIHVVICHAHSLMASRMYKLVCYLRWTTHTCTYTHSLSWCLANSVCCIPIYVFPSELRMSMRDKVGISRYVYMYIYIYIVYVHTYAPYTCGSAHNTKYTTHEGSS